MRNGRPAEEELGGMGGMGGMEKNENVEKEWECGNE